LPIQIFLKGLGIGRERYRSWCKRYGKENEHNVWIPRDHWILPEEREKIITFYGENGLEGYRRLTYIMMDDDIVYVSPSTTYRVLLSAGLIRASDNKKSKKGTGFKQPQSAHSQWHTDITYIKIKGLFYYLILVLDGYSRYMVSWVLRERMSEQDVQIAIQKAHERFPDVKPRIISDNGSQYISKEFKQLITLIGMTHTTTSPYYPQSNGKLERCNKTIKDYLKTMYIADYKDGCRIMGEFIDHYNNQRLHSAIGYITPHDKLFGQASKIQKRREEKLQKARSERKTRRRMSKNNNDSANQ
jgi:transposase InsO family protein